MTTLSDYEDGTRPGAPELADMEDDDREIARKMIDRIEEVPQVGEATGRFEDADGVEVDDVMGSGGGRLPAWDLPGFAEETKQDDCGHEEPHLCDECGKVHGRSRTCAQSRCPRCWKRWAMERAETHVARADAVARTLGSDGTAHHKHHVAFMLPPDWRPKGSPEERYRETQKAVRDIISDIWGDDAMFVYHGWSGSGYGDDGGRGEGAHNDLGEWADRLPDGVDDRQWEGDVRDELFQRPHFHAIIVSDHVPGGDITARVHEATGWVIRRFADDEGRSIYGETREEEMEALARATTYTLSHTSVQCPDDDDNDAKIHTCGSVWRDYRNIKTLDDTELEAKRAVRAVAPKTLNLSENEIACDEEIAPERAAGDDADEHYSEDHGDDEDGDAGAPGTSFTGRVINVDESAGTMTIQTGAQQRTVRADELSQWRVGDKVSAQGEIDDDGVMDGELSDPRVDCQGTMRHIDEAGDLLDDDEWVDRAQWSDQAMKWYDWWTGADGAPPEPPPT